jgi:hypothetical protein
LTYLNKTSNNSINYKIYPPTPELDKMSLDKRDNLLDISNIISSNVQFNTDAKYCTNKKIFRTIENKTIYGNKKENLVLPFYNKEPILGGKFNNDEFCENKAKMCILQAEIYRKFAPSEIQEKVVKLFGKQRIILEKKLSQSNTEEYNLNNLKLQYNIFELNRVDFRVQIFLNISENMIPLEKLDIEDLLKLCSPQIDKAFHNSENFNSLVNSVNYITNSIDPQTIALMHKSLNLLLIAYGSSVV